MADSKKPLGGFCERVSEDDPKIRHKAREYSLEGAPVPTGHKTNPMIIVCSPFVYYRTDA